MGGFDGFSGGWSNLGDSRANVYGQEKIAKTFLPVWDNIRLEDNLVHWKGKGVGGIL